MKTFVIFLGIFLLSLTFLTYQGDMSRYLQLRTALKAAAEEAAAGAALYYDEEAFSEGLMVISEGQAERYVEYVALRAAEAMRLPAGQDLRAEMEIRDDRTGSNEEGAHPSVTVTMILRCGDLFRLPFLTVTEVRRAARYELAAS